MDSWRQRDIEDDVLRALHLVTAMNQQGCDGVELNNDALKMWFGVERVHRPRIEDMAARISHLFPYVQLTQDYQHRAAVILGTTKGKAPAKKRYLTDIPTLHEIEKALGIRIVTWSRKSDRA